MIWPWQDFKKGSRIIRPDEALSLIIGSVKMHELFGFGQLLSLIAIDDAFLALEYSQARRFASAVNDNYNWSWEKDILDCDDQESMFRASRVKGRWKAGFEKAEAFGGMDYFSKSRKGQHWASWAIVVENGAIRMKVYQPDMDQWQETDAECGDVLFFDA